MRISNLLFLLTLLTANFTHSQISSSDQKKIRKIIGEDFLELAPSEKYHYHANTSGLLVDTSTTFKGDTIGLVFNNEYVMLHDLIASRKSKELAKYLAPSPVTVGEYEDFKVDVRDSIAILKLYHGLDEDREANKYILFEDEYTDFDGVVRKVSSSDREVQLIHFNLDRSKKFSYNDVELVPVLADMYFPAYERFRNKCSFDERKFSYSYNEKIDSLLPDRNLFKTDLAYRVTCFRLNAAFRTMIIVSNDNHFWAKSANHIFDELSVFAQLYASIEEENPVVGVLGSQAKAFCHWKQEQLQKELNQAKIPFAVVVTLPEKNDLKSVISNSSLNIPKYDATKNWKISEKEYSKFVDHVMDSISRMELYFNLKSDQKALKLLKYKSIYFDETALEYVELDFTKRDVNLGLFPLNFKTKINKKNLEVKEIVDNLSGSSGSYFKYTYQSKRASGIAKKYEGPFRLDERVKYVNDNSFNCDFKNTHGSGSGVRCIHSYERYMETHRVSIFPEDVISLDEKSEELIPWLTYEQALAFYNWKYRIDKFNPKKEDWQQFVFPSKEQFNSIQQGESIIVPEHEVEFPTPLFRYVVHIYPK